MSWGIYAHDFPPEVHRLKDLQPDFKPKPIGGRAEIAAKILRVAPSATFAADRDSGDIDGPGYSIEIFFGKEEPCTGVAFSVRGVNPDVVDVIADILDELGLRAAQSGQGDDFFDRKASRRTFVSWRAYRDQIARIR